MAYYSGLRVIDNNPGALTNGDLTYKRGVEGFAWRHRVPYNQYLRALAGGPVTPGLDTAIRTTIDRVDETADRVRSNVRAKTSRVVGLVRGARVALEHMLMRAA